MTTYFYQTGNLEFKDNIPFGTAWSNILAIAMKNHTPIYRTVIRKNGKVEYQVFTTGKVFCTVENVEKADLMAETFISIGV